MQVIYKALATGLFISYLPSKIIRFKKNACAGFLGTLRGLPLVLALPDDPFLYAVSVLLVWLLALWVCKKVQFKGYTGHDNPKIVIDEIAGYVTAMAFVPKSAGFLAAAFVLFRLFDTTKPLFVKTFDRMENAFGVVFDDVAAGIMANIVLQIFIFFK